MSADKQPRLGVALAVVSRVVGQEPALLLWCRARGGNNGMWVLREVLEETGVRVEVMDEMPIYVMEIIGYSSHRVCLVARAVALEGQVSGKIVPPSDEFSAVEWVPLSRSVKPEFQEQLSTPVQECLFRIFPRLREPLSGPW